MTETVDQKVIVPASPAAPANTGVPTQIANPKRASWRTYVQSVVGFLIGANIVLPILQSFLETTPGLEPMLGDSYGFVLGVVNLGIVILGLISKLIAQLMAHPKVNAWITANLSWLAPIKTID